MACSLGHAKSLECHTAVKESCWLRAWKKTMPALHSQHQAHSLVKPVFDSLGGGQGPYALWRAWVQEDVPKPPAEEQYMLAHMQELRRQVQANQQREAQKKVQSVASALLCMMRAHRAGDVQTVRVECLGQNFWARPVSLTSILAQTHLLLHRVSSTLQ